MTTVVLRQAMLCALCATSSVLIPSCAPWTTEAHMP
jgi:hypothetical protein